MASRDTKPGSSHRASSVKPTEYSHTFNHWIPHAAYRVCPFTPTYPDISAKPVIPQRQIASSPRISVYFQDVGESCWMIYPCPIK